MVFKRPGHYFTILCILLPFMGWCQLSDTSVERPDHNANLTFLLAERWLVTEKHFDVTGVKRDNLVEYGYFSTLVEAEYGFSERLSAFLHFPFLNYTYTVTPLSLQKVAVWKTGDPELGVIYNLSPGRNLSARAGLYLGLPLGFHGQGALNTGDGEFNQMIKLEVGEPYQSFDDVIWWELYTGVNHRTRQNAEEFVFGAEAGMQVIREKLDFAIQVDGIKAFGNSAGAVNINAQSLFSNFRERLVVTPRVGFQVFQNLEVRIETAIPITGRNYFANPTFGISLYLQNKIPQG